MHAGELIINDEKDNILSSYGILNVAPEEIMNIPEGAIVAKKETPYQVKLLIDRKHASNLEGLQPATLERNLCRYCERYYLDKIIIQY